MSKYDVFISYSHNDKEIAQGVCHFLEENGIRCWLNHRDISVGEVWAKTIVKAISDTAVVIAILSKSYNNSPSCENEIAISSNREKPIVCLKVDDSELSGLLKYYLTNNWIDATDNNESVWRNELLKSIQNLLHKKNNEASISRTDTGNPTGQESIQKEKKSKKRNPESSEWKSTLFDNGEKDALLKLSSNVPSKVYLDGEYICEIGIKEVVKIPLDYGAYIVGLDDKENPQSYRAIDVDIPVGTHSKALIVEMPSSDGLKESVGKISNKREEIKCFIAGSKMMMEERNAMRVVVSNMYHNWKSFNFLIEVFSFDNFEHTMSEKGHQEEYNQFIANEADLVLFLFDNTVGDKTLEELDTAIDSYKKNKRPKIIVYVKKHDNYSPVIEELNQRLKKEDVYWVDYTSIENLSMNFERDLNAMLFRRMQIE